MNDEERLRTLVRALLPFALAAENWYVTNSDEGNPLLIRDPMEGYIDTIRTVAGYLTADDLRAAAAALEATGHADALTDTDARAALEGDE